MHDAESVGMGAGLSPLKRAMLAIERLEEKVQRLDSAQHEPIAIVGIGCRFPGAGRGPERFWQFLMQGGDAISEIPSSRWPAESYYDPDPERPGTMYSRFGGFIPDLGSFDERVFGISPREADRMDPQQRLLLECSWSALEDAGYPPRSMNGSRTGVYFGLCSDEYSQAFAVRDGFADIDAYTFTGATFSIAAGRVSYLLGLIGPAMVVDTACSSSLVCVHLACQALRARECDMALAGGATAILSPAGMICMSRLRALSPDGRCKTFDAGADGYARGEGCGVLVLRRLSDALKEGQDIVAIVRGSAVNQDGRSLGLTAPSQRAQGEVIQQALKRARVQATEVEFVETHGTGTPLGDPIEVEALASVYGKGDHPCGLGAVKSNLGHTEGAAGVAGMIKLALSLRAGVKPKNLHFNRLNPRIELSQTRLSVATEAMDWPRRGDAQRTGAVSGFGISGTNCHVILQEAPAAKRPTSEPRQVYIFPLSPAAAMPEGADVVAGLTPIAGPTPIAELAREWKDWIESRDVSLEQIVATAACRDAGETRWALPCETRAELLEGLQELSGEGDSATWLHSDSQTESCVFVFSGQGGQWPGMGRALLQSNAAFRTAIEQCSLAILQRAGWDVLAELEAAGPETVWPIDRIQPLLFSYQVGLARAWMEYGVHPKAVVGHSVGEVAAAHIADILDLDTAVQIVVARSQRLAALPQNGAMALVELTEGELRELLGDGLGGTELAVVSDRRSVVVAGRDERVAQVLLHLKERGVFARRVDVTIASHCSFVKDALPGLRADLVDLRPSKGKIAMISSARGGRVEGTELDRDYWVEQLASPVRFADAIESLLGDEARPLFLEVAPHPSVAHSLQSLVQRRVNAAAVVSPMRRDRPEPRSFMRGMAELWTRGAPVRMPAWSGATVSGGPVRAWAGALRPLDYREASVALAIGGRRDRLGKGQRDPERALVVRYALTVDLHTWPWLADHVVNGRVIWPAAATIALCLTAARLHVGTDSIELADVQFCAPLELRFGQAIELKLLVETTEASGAGTLRLFAASAHDDVSLEIARARFLGAGEAPAVVAPVQLHDVVLPDEPAEEFYHTMKQRGLEFGPLFRGVTSVTIAGEGARATVSTRAARVEAEPSLAVHPAVLDACLQCAAALPGTPDGLWLPAAIARLRFWGKSWEGHRVRVAVSRDYVEASDRRSVSLQLGADGGTRCEVQGLVFQQQVGSRGASILDEWLMKPHWVELPHEALPVLTPEAGQWYVVGEQQPLRGALSERLGGLEASVTELRQMLSRPDSAVLRGVVFVARNGTSGPAPDAADVAAGAADYGQLLELLRVLVANGSRTPPRLWIVSRGLMRVRPTDVPGGLGQSLLWGLAATVAHELPELAVGCVDLEGLGGADHPALPARTDPALELADCARLLSVRSDENQFALRANAVYVPRLRSWARSSPAMSVAPPSNAHFALEQWPRGSLEGLGYRLRSARPPEAGQVQLRVRSAALNFRDVLLSLGALDDAVADGETHGGGFGGECAGVVTAVGEGVLDLRAGDEVVALVDGALASHCTADRSRVFTKPAALSWDEAAGFQLASMTAWYSLIDVARLQAGESVLIHSAAGGVGLAAVQIARSLGATIHATAGTQSKRDWLREHWGVARVYDSRSIAFRDELKGETGGRGVDVVLNSLAGHAIEASLECLAPYGRFVEIGKRDYLQGRGISLGAMLKSIEFHLVDLLMLAHRKPARFQQLAQDVWTAFDAGKLRSVIGQVFAAGDVCDAFVLMSQGKHRGKVCIDFAGDSVRQAAAQVPGKDGLRSDCAYVVTGGLGALGWHTAQWMSRRGAGQLLLLGRRDHDAAIEEELLRLRQHGCDAHYFAVDVGQPARVARFFDEYRRSKHARPIAGVVHSTLVLEDSTVLEQDIDALERVLRPKAHAAAALHINTLSEPLDFFVLYSSASSVFGSPGQSNYAAANAYLDALAHHRRSLGLPALSVNWGPWAEIGQAAQKDNRGRRMEGRGMSSLTPEQGWELFEHLFTACGSNGSACASESQLVVAKLDLRQWQQYYPRASALGLVSELHRDGQAAVSRAAVHGEFLQKLRGMPPAGRQDTMQTWLREQLGAILRLPAKDVGLRAPFKALGVDSLMSLEVRNRVEAALNLRLSATILWTWPNVEQLAKHLLETAFEEASGACVSAPLPVAPGAEEVVESLAVDDVEALAAMSDEELAEFLGV